MKFLLILVLVASLKIVYAQQVLCSEDFCGEYLTTNTCRDIPEECQVQNATHNGIFLPFYGPCNCCDFCLKNLKEDEQCAVGTSTSPIPSSICGPMLACTSSDNKQQCKKLISDCTKAQDIYDQKEIDGTLGNLEVRPECDEDGDFKPYHCIPGEICYCVNKQGERIFGEVSYTTTPDLTSKCSCSRSYDDAKTLIGRELHPQEHFRCISNGDYDTLQCIGNACTCVDNSEGHISDPKMGFVNVSYITPVTVSCYDDKVHAPISTYYLQCEKMVVEMLNEIDKMESESEIEVFGFTLPKCQIDGNYAAVQTTFDKKFCVSPGGTQLDEFFVDKSDPLAANMNCNCARVRSSLTSLEKPVCCANGNYKSIQCRRGMCRCVDTNGNQIEKEVPIDQMDQLSCSKQECTT